MSFLDQIFDIFSRREKPNGAESLTIPEGARYKAFMFCNDAYGNTRAPFGSGSSYVEEFWSDLHKKLQYRHGKPWLTEHGKRRQSPFEDAGEFIMTCSTDHYFDFLEYIFNSEVFFHVQRPAEDLVEELNQLIQTDNLPLFLTHFVKEEVQEPGFRGQISTVIYTRQYPRVVLKTAEVLHVQATLPVLELLRRPEYSAANAEYLAALEDYRKGDLGDAVTKAGSAFESVMTVLCKRKGWSYRETDTANTLLTTILGHVNLEPFFKDVLLIVATVRNRLSTAHGAGAGNRVVSPQLAEFVLNATATYILLLVKETGEY